MGSTPGTGTRRDTWRIRTAISPGPEPPWRGSCCWSGRGGTSPSAGVHGGASLWELFRRLYRHGGACPRPDGGYLRRAAAGGWAARSLSAPPSWGRGGSLAVTAAPELERRIAALVSSGQEDVSFSQAEGRLREWLNRRRVNRSVGAHPPAGGGAGTGRRRPQGGGAGQQRGEPPVGGAGWFGTPEGGAGGGAGDP